MIQYHDKKQAKEEHVYFGLWFPRATVGCIIKRGNSMVTRIGSFLHTGITEQTRRGVSYKLLKPHPLWHTCTSKALLPCYFPNNIANWGLSVHIHESIGNIWQSSNHIDTFLIIKKIVSHGWKKASVGGCPFPTCLTGGLCEPTNRRQEIWINLFHSDNAIC